ncbi:hypothetical protein [Paraburkholderia hospita]|uniref:hypothetical protein n=1 Tax=Paraburkholderia hospita TaxID=169430 RepID=UPI003ECE3CE4
MKTVKFLSTWAIHISLFYAWLVLGYVGAYNVIAALIIFSGLLLLLGNFLPDEKLREIAGRRHWFRDPVGTALNLSEIALLLWIGRIWLATFYMVAWGLIKIRVCAAREQSIAKREAA